MFRRVASSILVVLMTICAMVVCACSAGGNADQSNAQNENALTIGFSMGTLLEDRWVRDRDIFLSRAQQQGIEVIVTNANRDSDVQYKQVEDMLKQGIDILVLAPNDSIKEKKCVDIAKSYGVPVISYDRLVFDANVDAYVSFDNFEVGVQMAEALVKQVPEGGYLLVGGSPNDSNSTTIMEGVGGVIQTQVESGKIKILDQTWIDGWIREDAYEFTAQSIQRFGDQINGIIVGNDSLAWGVIDALSEAQMEDSVYVTGQDADIVACRRIVEGKQLMTVYKPIKELVDETMALCVALKNGEKITTSQKINDGTYDVPFRPCNVIPVTAENMEETVIKDGFHLKEEIFRQTGQ